MSTTNTKHIILRAPHSFSPYVDTHWMRILEGLMLEWRWGEYTEMLKDALEGIDRKLYPHLYSIKTATVGVNKFLRALPQDHDAILLSYSDDKGLTIKTCNEDAPGCEIAYYGNTDSHLEDALGKLTPPKHGEFVLNNERWAASNFGPTNNTMYDCVECKEAGRTHKIVEIPGPPAPGNEVSFKGDPTHYNQCTCCKAVTGAWVPAPY